MRIQNLLRAGVLVTSALLSLVFVASAKADVTLTTSAPFYPLGETVSFVLANQTEWMIQLPQWPGWGVGPDSLRSHAAPCEVIPIVVDMHPGWSFDYEWDQHDCYTMQQVPPGRYRIVVHYWCESCPKYDNSVEVSFEIGMVPIEPASWGGIKALYR
jgi:hypothetical protein